MYVQGFIVPVPADKQDEYRAVAEKFWPIAQDYGATEHVECWEENVPDGKQTDFRRSVDLAEGEKVVFSWVIWPDKATCDASHDKMMTDPRMELIPRLAGVPIVVLTGHAAEWHLPGVGRRTPVRDHRRGSR